MARSRAFARLLPSAVAALGLAACEAQRSGRSVAAEGTGSTWRWRAEKMEVSALSTPAPAREGAAALIEAHVEFFDADGDETKAIGSLAVTVQFDGNQVGRLVADLEGMGGHARFWDRATRTYALRIPLAADPPAGRSVTVRASFEGVDGSRMTASREVRWPERGR